MALLPIAQATSDWIAPVSGTAAVGFLTALARWLMVTITKELAELKNTINEHTRSLEKALDHNTRATLLMGIAAEQSNSELRDKLKACYAELEKKEELNRARRDKDV